MIQLRHIRVLDNKKMKMIERIKKYLRLTDKLIKCIRCMDKDYSIYDEIVFLCNEIDSLNKEVKERYGIDVN